MNFRIEKLKNRHAEIAGRIIRSRSDYFTYEPTIFEYCSAAAQVNNYSVVAYTPNSQPIGIAILAPVNESTAELVLIAVLSEYQRMGIGTAMLENLQNQAKNIKKKFLLLKTIGPSDKDPLSDIALAFFIKNDICILCEYDNIWEGSSCAIMAKAL